MPTGLNNLGNTCFMNSALQCIISSELFIQGYLINKFYLGVTDHKQKKINRVDLLNAMYEFAKASNSSISSFSPSHIKSLVANRNSLFRGYGQQDTHELLIFLLDELHEESNFIPKDAMTIEIDDNDPEPDPKTVWNKYKQRFDSAVIDLFSGQYKGTVQCQSCDHISNTYDPFQFVSVPIPSSLEILVFHDQIYQVKIALNETVASLKAKLFDKFQIEFVVWDMWNFRLFNEKSDYDHLEKDLIAYPKLENSIKIRFSYKNRNIPFPLMLDGNEDLKPQVTALIAAYTSLGNVEFGDLIKERDDSYCIELEADLDTPNVLRKVEINLIENLDSNFTNFQQLANKRKQEEGIEATTLEDCLLHFLEPEELNDATNLYKCPKCKDFKPALKYTLFNHTPSILVFQLKRFQSSGNASYYSRTRKVEDFIDFPMELDISTLVVGKPVEVPVDGSTPDHPDYYKYELYAVDNHYGGLGGGHYTAHTKHGDIWYDCDDSRITPLGNDQQAESRIKSKSAYLLFYKRKSATVASVKAHYEQLFTIPSPHEEQSQNESMASFKKRQNIIDSDDDSLYNNAASDLDIMNNSPIMSDEDESNANLASMGLPMSKTASNLSQSEQFNYSSVTHSNGELDAENNDDIEFSNNK